MIHVCPGPARRARTALAAAALAVAALVPAAADAAPAKATATKPTTQGAAPSAAPAQPALAPVPAVQAQPPTPGGSATQASFVGMSVGALSGALGLQLDYGFVRTPRGFGKLELEWHVVVGAAMPTSTAGLDAVVYPPIGPGPVAVSSGQEKVSAYVLEVVPTARVLYPVTQGFAFIADGGLGLVQTFETHDRSEMYYGHTTQKEYVTGLVLHLGLGLIADVTPRWRVVFLPLAYSLQLGPSFSGFAPSLGVAYRL